MVNRKSIATFVSRRLLPVFCLLIFAGPTAQAIPLSDYHQKLRQAISALDTFSQSDETESEADSETRRNETIDGVRTLLPRSVTVEWEGATLNVDYSWLHRELDTLGSASGDERTTIGRRMTERLQAIEDRVSELEEAYTKSGSKAEDSRKLAEILQRPEYARKIKQESAIARLISRLLEWIKNLFPKPKPLAPGTAGVLTQIAQVFVVLLALGVLAFALKMFLPRFLRGRKSKKKSKEKARIVLGEKLEPDQSALDLLADAETLARQGDLRAAIRKAYIALLVELGDRKIISLAQHKTNRDYLSAVRDVQPLYGNVRTLTETFERHWYGLVNANESDWLAFRAGYKQALSR